MFRRTLNYKIWLKEVLESIPDEPKYTHFTLQ